MSLFIVDLLCIRLLQRLTSLAKLGRNYPSYFIHILSRYQRHSSSNRYQDLSLKARETSERMEDDTQLSKILGVECGLIPFRGFTTQGHVRIWLEFAHHYEAVKFALRCMKCLETHIGGFRTIKVPSEVYLDEVVISSVDLYSSFSTFHLPLFYKTINLDWRWITIILYHQKDQSISCHLTSSQWLSLRPISEKESTSSNSSYQKVSKNCMFVAFPTADIARPHMPSVACIQNCLYRNFHRSSIGYLQAPRCRS